MTGWQPIETAPKDGSHVLLFVTYSNHTPEQIVGFWPHQDRPDMDDAGTFRLVQCGAWAEGNSINGSPTHWMPLPDGPS